MHKLHHNGKMAGSVLAKHPLKSKRRTAARKTRETWEEFKEKSNRSAEAALEEVTNPDALRVRARHAARQARSFWSDYKYWILGAFAALFVVRRALSDD